MHKQDTAITIERLNQTNISSLPVLYRAVYGRKITTAFFQKKYETVYTALVYVGYIAYAKGRQPVAFLGAIPCELNYGAKIIPAAQLTDGMTDPACRNKGLFIQLVDKITELCKQNNLLFLFGFPNQHSLPVFINRLGWSGYGKMDMFCVTVTTAIPLEKISGKFSILRNLYGRYFRWVLKKYKAMPAADVSSTDPGVYQNDKYRKYKYQDSMLISIRHALVRIKIGHGMIIGEMRVSEKEFDDVMNLLKKLSRKLGISAIFFSLQHRQ